MNVLEIFSNNLLLILFIAYYFHFWHKLNDLKITYRFYKYNNYELNISNYRYIDCNLCIPVVYLSTLLKQNNNYEKKILSASNHLEQQYICISSYRKRGSFLMSSPDHVSRHSLSFTFSRRLSRFARDLSAREVLPRSLITCY